MNMASKNKSMSSSDKNKKGKDGQDGKDKKGRPVKKEIIVSINESDAAKIIKSVKPITAHELARQTGVRISTANAYLVKSMNDGIVKRVGGFSGHHIYVPVS